MIISLMENVTQELLACEHQKKLLVERIDLLKKSILAHFEKNKMVEVICKNYRFYQTEAGVSKRVNYPQLLVHLREKLLIPQASIDELIEINTTSSALEKSLRKQKIKTPLESEQKNNE